ncbi:MULTISPECIES: ABC transporter ATP-binding protein [unclassified Paenibacillus]|uniref:ABC transporter ATP-binding protein n=1 Tax=unclassified Paenibacillus TaxID=185978 RepID=UPI001C106E1A|nr:MULTISPECIES: ABC transporter ATP-binding protein [unclassified Paenibacillus]MBU5443647.1 ABC transporter ATP-binding protein [Paenibacillus sp. MSJ-34]CAH0117690.1 Linearmycin resistance ATP-binding protein LnrL [Paenibacillus sp. CECT 9249]
MTAIQTIDLTKEFRHRTAVNSLNLSIEKGEFFALLGQNGAGKTTTIKMLTCLLPPTSGDALLLGDSINKHPEAVKRKINVSPQETAVAPNLTVKENLELMARIYGKTKREAKATAIDMMSAFGLSERAVDKAKTLSGGMQRRLSIAMALISDPDIVFLDEPTLGLDVRARRELWKHIFELKGKVTIILTTHYLEEAEALSDKIGIMHEGKLQALGTAEELQRATGQATLEDSFLALTEEEVMS